MGKYLVYCDVQAQRCYLVEAPDPDTALRFIEDPDFYSPNTTIISHNDVICPDTEANYSVEDATDVIGDTEKDSDA